MQLVVESHVESRTSLCVEWRDMVREFRDYPGGTEVLRHPRTHSRPRARKVSHHSQHKNRGIDLRTHVSVCQLTNQRTHAATIDPDQAAPGGVGDQATVGMSASEAPLVQTLRDLLQTVQATPARQVCGYASLALFIRHKHGSLHRDV